MKKTGMLAAITLMLGVTALTGCGKALNGDAAAAQTQTAKAETEAATAVPETEAASINTEAALEETYIKFVQAVANEDAALIKEMSVETIDDTVYQDLYSLAGYLEDTNDLNMRLLVDTADDLVVRVTNATLNETGDWLDLGFAKRGSEYLFSPEAYRSHICGVCGSSGQVYSGGTTCGICSGTGQMYVPNAYYDAIMGWQGQWQMCSGCAGVGSFGGQYTACGACAGNGYV